MRPGIKDRLPGFSGRNIDIHLGSFQTRKGFGGGVQGGSGGKYFHYFLLIKLTGIPPTG
jgi:hypothetical protein